MQKPKKTTVMTPNKEQITLIILQTTSEGSQQILALLPPQRTTHDNQLQLTAASQRYKTKQLQGEA
jgi:hypothetical protein